MRKTFLALGFTLALILAMVGFVPTAAADSTTPVRVDAHVQQSAPNTNYATSTTLSVNSSSTAKRWTYVKVDVPTVPSGETVNSAALRVYVTGTIPTGAAWIVDSVDNNWTETNVTYNNGPGLYNLLISDGTPVVAGWNSIPIPVPTPGSTVSYRIRDNVSATVTFSSQEGANSPALFIDTTASQPPTVQNPSAVRTTEACGQVGVAYATGTSDNTASTFTTTVDGAVVDTRTVAAPGGSSTFTTSLAEDFSGGMADVVVSANGAQEIAFTVNTDCAQPVVQTPTATRTSVSCGALAVSYATGANDNASSTFVTTVDGVTVDNEVVAAPNGSGGHNAALVEDSSGGVADVVVSANGDVLLSFTVVTDCVSPPIASWPPATPILEKRVGMSAPEDLWDERVQQVGACGITARRIFVPDTSSNWSGKFQTVQEAIADGQTPVISFKEDLAGLMAGNYDTLFTNVRNQLASLDAPVTATFWHEPHGNMTAAEFRAASQKFFTLMDHPDIAVGPILNGWLLDNQVDVFASYTSPALLDQWEFMGVDSYHSDPGSTKMPGRALYLVEDWLDNQGHGSMPLILGEYNGFDANAVAYGGEAILSIPEVWIGLVWNSTGGTFTPLEGDRITAYQATKSDSRAYLDC